MRGEVLTPDSFLLVNALGKGQMNIKTVERRRRTLLQRAGKDEKSETGLVHWNKLHFHVLRSYFTTQCLNSAIEENVVKFFRGDRGGTIQGYFMKGNGEEIPEETLAVAEGKYRRALGALTVTGDSEMVKKLARQLDEQGARKEDDYTALTAKLLEKEQDMEQLRKKQESTEQTLNRILELLEKRVRVDPSLLRLKKEDLPTAG